MYLETYGVLDTKASASSKHSIHFPSHAKKHNLEIVAKDKE